MELDSAVDDGGVKIWIDNNYVGKFDYKTIKKFVWYMLQNWIFFKK